MTPRRRVLVVETRAHLQRGHWPVVFAHLADALTELGVDVEVLVQRGWTLDGDPAFTPRPLHRYGPTARVVAKVVRVLGRGSERPRVARLAEVLTSCLVVTVADRLARRLGIDEIIVVTQVDPVAAGFAARRGRWLLYQFRGPTPTGRLARGSERVVRRRRRSGTRVHVATSAPGARAAWAAAMPWLDPVALPFIAARTPTEPADRADARRTLGLPEHARLALQFGVVHSGKDGETVWNAFADATNWQLVVAGAHAADGYRAWAARRSPATAPILIEGYVPEETRALLFDAVDVVVLSITPGKPSDSGNLVEAIAAGRPVVCSDRCGSADVVREFGLGPVYAPGDPAALADALTRVLDQLDADGLARARAALSPGAAARANLDALAS